LILVIDNYDSFTYNLVDLIQRFTEVAVIRHDETGPEVVEELRPAGIVISPGPGRPKDSGISMAVVARYYREYPMLGVCLGHQVIAEVLGGKVINAEHPMHGKTSLLFHEDQGIFKGLTQGIEVMRYHSLIVEPHTLPEDLLISAWTDRQEVMGIRHKIYNLSGVQFHPESILTSEGEGMVLNWLASIRTSNIYL
jgi:anthranilate synthase component 2